MKKLLLLLLLCQTLSTSAQVCSERVEKAGWMYFSIADKAYPEVDSIRYIISKPFHTQNPTIFFSQGSGNYPVLIYDDHYFGKDSALNYAMIPPFSVNEYVKNYNFVVIAKPGTPICKPHSEHLPLIDTAFGNYTLFTKMDFLDYYVEQLNQVVDNVRKQSKSDAPFYFVGNSQGGHVVAKFTEKYPQKVQCLVLQSCGVLDRYVEQIHEYRHLADQGKMSSKEAQQQIDEIYKYYHFLKGYSDHFSSKTDEKPPYSEHEHHRTMTDASYNFDLILFQLQHVNCPVLVVYGTADLKTRDNDLLPLFFTRWNKKNLTMMPVLDCDHVFMKTIINPETGEQKQEYFGETVFSDIEKWFSKNN